MINEMHTAQSPELMIVLPWLQHSDLTLRMNPSTGLNWQPQHRVSTQDEPVLEREKVSECVCMCACRVWCVHVWREREGGGGGGTHNRGVGREKLNLDVEILCQLVKGPLAPLVDRAVVQDHDAAGNVFAFDTRIHPRQNFGCHNVHELEGIYAANDHSIPNHQV